MDMRYINFVFAIGCFIAIMFAQTTQQQIVLSTASLANVIAIEARNIEANIKGDN